MSDPGVFHRQPAGTTACHTCAPEPMRRGPRNLSHVGYSVEGQGPAIVLLHSSMSHKGQWRDLVQDMSVSHRVIAVDLFGYGETPFPALIQGFGLRDEAHLVEWVLEGLLQPGESFHLVGHSYGGAVALRLAYGAPKRVRSLTLLEPVAFHLLARKDAALNDVQALAEVQAVARAVNRGLANNNPLPAAARFVDYWSGRGAFERLPKEKQQALAAQLRKVGLDFLAACSEPLSLDDYRAISLPTCLIAGLFSPHSTLSVTAALAKHLPDAQLHWVNGGHMTPIQQPDKINPIIAGFIHQVDAFGVSFGPESGWHVNANPSEAGVPEQRRSMVAPVAV